MRFKKEIKDRLYGGYLGVVTDKIDFEIIKVMLADDKKKVEVVLRQEKVPVKLKFLY